MDNRLDFFPNDDLVVEYRKVFTSKGADEVLLHMLFDSGIFEESEKQEDVVLRNQGIRLLKILGGGDVQKETIREFIKRLVRQPLKKEKTDG